MARKPKTARTKALPSREQILEYLANHPGSAGKREIARAFSVTGSDKIALKAMLKDMQSDGAIERRGRKLAREGDLPAVLTLDIAGRDSGSGLLAVPARWNEEEQGPAPRISIRQPRGRNPVVAGVGDRVLARIEPAPEGPKEWLGRVMKVLDRRKDAVLGILRLTESGARLEPITRKQAEIEIAALDVGKARDGDLVEVETFSGRRYGLRQGRVIGVLGPVSGERALSMIAIHAHGIPHVFSPETLREAETIEPVTAADMKSREDWRKLPLVTIDPPDAKDHDDAVYAEPDPDSPGGHIATVAIADVGAYVRPGTALDREARLRGNSVYFPDRVVPMLPERISNDLCSLKPHEDRPAIAVRMWFAADGRKVRHEFHRVLMRSHARLSYGQAQAAIDGQSDRTTKPILETVLEPLWEAWRCLHRGRAAREPLELDLPERKAILRPDGTLERVVIPERLDAHRLIEEFMIQANVAAAETLEQKRQALIYRVHDAPALDKLESLRQFLRSLGLKLARSGNLRASLFNRILAMEAGGDRQALINQVVLRAQSQAEYSPKNIGHFGLNLMRYAHFTSPIRRYADLVVHRALITALHLGTGGLSQAEAEQLAETAAEISRTERRAMIAERDTIDRLVAAHLSERIGDIFAGRINGVTRAGLFVTLDDTGADGFVPAGSLGGEYFRYEEARHSMVGSRSGMIYQIGQRVEVRLLEAAPAAGALRFEIVDGEERQRSKPRPMTGRRQSHRGRRTRR
jgi:ribonuclease R